MSDTCSTDPGATHYSGCPCHEAAHREECERLRGENAALKAKLADAQFEATKWRNIAQGDIGMKSAYEHEALEHGATRERLEAAEARVKELEGSRQQARAEALEEAARTAETHGKLWGASRDQFNTQSVPAEDAIAQAIRAIDARAKAEAALAEYQRQGENPPRILESSSDDAPGRPDFETWLSSGRLSPESDIAKAARYALWLESRLTRENDTLLAVQQEAVARLRDAEEFEERAKKAEARAEALDADIQSLSNQSANAARGISIGVAELTEISRKRAELAEARTKKAESELGIIKQARDAAEEAARIAKAEVADLKERIEAINRHEPLGYCGRCGADLEMVGTEEEPDAN